MTEYQTALALWDEDKELEKEFTYAPDVEREYETADTKYNIYYWHWTPMPFDESILNDKRHAMIQFSEDNEFYHNIVSEDSRGCDEEFDFMFNWQLAIFFEGANENINDTFI